MFWVVSLGYLYFHNDIHTDTLLADTVIFSIWQLAAYFKGKKPVHFYLGMAGIGLSMLAKGPVGLAIPAFATGIHLVLHRQWKEIFHLRWVTGAVVVFVIIIPALAGLFNQFGPEGIKFYFWTNNMGRITGSYAGKNSDPFFYIHTSLSAHSVGSKGEKPSLPDRSNPPPDDTGCRFHNGIGFGENKQHHKEDGFCPQCIHHLSFMDFHCCFWPLAFP